MRKNRVAFALLFALGACGGEDEQQTFEPPALIDEPVAYFGMEPCTCYEYAPAAEWEAGESSFSRKLGVAVENFGGEVRLGRDYHVIRYRMMGTANRVVRQEFLDPTDPELLVAAIDPTGESNAPYLRFDPPASLVRAERDPDSKEAILPVGSLITSKAETTEVSPVEEAPGPEVRVSAQYLPEEEVEIGFWDEIAREYARETLSATPIRYSGAEGLESGQRRWFVPERGFVKMTLDLLDETETWVLVNTRELVAEGCTPEGAEPTDWCGT